MSDQTQMGEQTAEQTAIENPTQEDVVETQPELAEPDTATEAQADDTNEAEPPKDNAAWAAMRVENKRLKEQLSATASVDDEYLNESRQFANATGQYYAPVQLDENTDIAQISQTIEQANRAAADAASRVRQLEIALEEQEMFNQFPHFKEDKLAQQLVAEKKIVSKTLGRERRYVDIAREVDRLVRRDRETVEAQARESERQATTAKLAATTQTPSYSSSGMGDDREALRARARRGDISAQTELAKAHLDGMDFNF